MFYLKLQQAAMKSVSLVTLVWLSVSAVSFEEPEVTTESYDLPSFITTVPATEAPNDNGMTLGEIPEIPSASVLEGNGDHAEPHAVLIAFPDNHKNFTPSHYLGEEEFPPYYTHLNPYQHQYKNYNEQKQLYNQKPIKFEENSTKNLYLQGNYAVWEPNYDNKKPEELRVTRKPFPYAFESEKASDNWYKNSGSGHVLVLEEPGNKYLMHEHQENIPSYYAFPHRTPHDYKFYKNEVPRHEHSEHYDVGKDEKVAEPWKKVFKLLTALVPLGLFLATLTPNVISINSTTNTKTTRQRSEDASPLRFKEEDVLRLLNEYGVESLSESQCEDRVICELARKGDESSASSIEKGFWYLANETPWDVAEKAGMNELFWAIKTGNCESYKCQSKGKSSGKGRFAKKLIRKRKISK